MMQGIKPTIMIKTYKPNPQALQEILAGIEEEGMLYTLLDQSSQVDSCGLAREAANMSRVQVGIGLNDKTATLCVHKLMDILLFDTNESFRLIGQNSGKYVKGNPFILEDMR